MPTVNDLIREAYSHWDDAKILSRTGRELHDRNRLDITKEVLARAVELDAGEEDAWVYLAFAYYRSFGDEEGSETLRRGIEATGSDDLKATLGNFTPDEEESKRLLAEVEGSEVPGIRSALASRRFYRGEKEALDEVRRLLEQHRPVAELPQPVGHDQPGDVSPDDDRVAILCLCTGHGAKADSNISGRERRGPSGASRGRSCRAGPSRPRRR